MSSALNPGTSLIRNARRLLVGCIDSTVLKLQQRSLTDAHVHTVRKQMKRIRAGLRLLRVALGDAAYKRLNRSVSDAASPLTSMRDAKILCEALEQIWRQSDPSVQNGTTQLRRTLRRERRLSRAKLSDKDLNFISARLRQVKQHLKDLPTSRLDNVSIEAVLKRAYKKAYKAFAVAEQEPSNEHLHEWRKQVKYHLHQFEVIQPINPKRIAAMVQQADRLSDLLGNDHDLALLHERITLYTTQTQATSDRAAFDEFINELKHRRAKLQRKSRQLGKKLYADKPNKMVQRLGK